MFNTPRSEEVLPPKPFLLYTDIDLPCCWVAKFNRRWRKAWRVMCHSYEMWVSFGLVHVYKLDSTSLRKPDQNQSMKTYFSWSWNTHNCVLQFMSWYQETIGETAWGKHSPPHPSRSITCSSCATRKAGDHFWNSWVMFSFTVRHLPVGVYNAKVDMGGRCSSSCCTEDVQSKEPRQCFGWAMHLSFLGDLDSRLHLIYIYNTLNLEFILF